MKFSNEAKIGILVVAVLAVLFTITVRSSDFHFSERGYELKAHFLNIDGVDKNAPVRLNGLEVGLVKDIKVLYGPQTTMELTLLIHDGVKIHEGVRASVKNLGLFGEKFIGLSLGDSTKEFIKPGTIIVGDEAANLDKIMADGEVIAANLKEISIQINERLKINSESIDDIIASLRVASSHIASISENVDERLTLNKHLIDDTIVNIHSATRNFDEMSSDLKLNPWKLMYREKVKKPATDEKK
jgi:phospholipid/cholesterol/gamma-HCH transport system substrate-binding protein